MQKYIVSTYWPSNLVSNDWEIAEKLRAVQLDKHGWIKIPKLWKIKPQSETDLCSTLFTTYLKSNLIELYLTVTNYSEILQLKC